jgi:hypothetical protein
VGYSEARRRAGEPTTMTMASTSGTSGALHLAVEETLPWTSLDIAVADVFL